MPARSVSRTASTCGTSRTLLMRHWDTTATSTEPAKLKLNLLALSDDLGFGSTLLPVEKGEYYASVDGIPFEFEDGTFIDILEATVNIV